MLEVSEQRGNWIGEMLNWSGFCDWPNGEGVASSGSKAMCLIMFEPPKS
jgi:hypothetical protein